MSNVNDLGSPGVGSTNADGGNYGNWGAVAITDEQSSISTNFTGGYMVTYGAIPLNNILGAAFTPQSLSGINTGYGAALSLNAQTIVSDLDPVSPHPKNQTIFFKMSGFNPNTQTLENWIISEEIVIRPELFDPTRSPPNLDFGVFTTPPSGHALTNIKIVARWIQ